MLCSETEQWHLQVVLGIATCLRQIGVAGVALEKGKFKGLTGTVNRNGILGIVVVGRALVIKFLRAFKEHHRRLAIGQRFDVFHFQQFARMFCNVLGGGHVHVTIDRQGIAGRTDKNGLAIGGVLVPKGLHVFWAVRVGARREGGVHFSDPFGERVLIDRRHGAATSRTSEKRRRGDTTSAGKERGMLVDGKEPSVGEQRADERRHATQ